MFTLSRDAVVLVEGNSNTAVDNPPHPYRMQQPLIEESDRVYLRRTSNPRRRQAPVWITTSFTGIRWDNIATRLPGFLATYNPTHVILECGTNDVSVTRATTQAALADVAAALTTQQVLVIGPYAYGEKWPSGENDGIGASNDARLDETADDIAAILVPAVANCTYVDLRSTIYEVTMPPLNSPSPGEYIGPFTVDGVHLAPPGRAAIYALYKTSVRFS